MGTKTFPGVSDCYARALPDEEMFTILARDPDFERICRKWATRRHQMVMCGERPDSDMRLVSEALECAFAGARWRKENNGIWRRVEAAR